MAKVGFWLQGSKGKLGGANLSQTAGAPPPDKEEPGEL